MPASPADLGVKFIEKAGAGRASATANLSREQKLEMLRLQRQQRDGTTESDNSKNAQRLRKLLQRVAELEVQNRVSSRVKTWGEEIPVCRN